MRTGEKTSRTLGEQKHPLSTEGKKAEEKEKRKKEGRDVWPL